jgi:hypothetical protein
MKFLSVHFLSALLTAKLTYTPHDKVQQFLYTVNVNVTVSNKGTMKERQEDNLWSWKRAVSITIIPWWQQIV